MTLILALRHSDGLVLASDSQATAMTASQPVRLSTVDKLFLVRDAVGWGASGSVGLIQQVQNAISSQDQGIVKDLENKGAETAAKRIFGLINPIQKEGIKGHISELAPGQPPPNICCIFIGYARGDPFILEVDKSGLWQFHTEPFFAIGSGDVFALHAVGSVAHYHIEKLGQRETLALAFRTVHDAIDTAAFGLGGKVQLIAVTKNKASRLSDGDLDAIEDTVHVWKEKEVEALGSLGLSTAEGNGSKTKNPVGTAGPGTTEPAKE
jgi:20S proteasome alpha/beta subunit